MTTYEAVELLSTQISILEEYERKVFIRHDEGNEIHIEFKPLENGQVEIVKMEYHKFICAGRWRDVRIFSGFNEKAFKQVFIVLYAARYAELQYESEKQAAELAWERKADRLRKAFEYDVAV